MSISTLSLLLIFTFSSTISAQNISKKQNTVTETKKTAEKPLRFIQFGIMSKNHNDFKEKYGIDVVYENCVISPLLSQQAKKNNIEVAKIASEKFGEIWKKDLGFTPYGL